MKNLPMKKTKRMVELRNKVRLGQHETKEFLELQELEFEHNKLDINFRLSGDNKYYYADQCHKFTNYILENGFNNFKAERIKSVSIVNCTHYGASINARLSSGGETHIKTFNNKHEMLGFICGFNFKGEKWIQIN